QDVGDMGLVSAVRALAWAEGLAKRIGPQSTNDEAAGPDLSDTDADGGPVVGDVLGLPFDFPAASTRCGFDEALPAVVSETPATGVQVVDLGSAPGGFDAEQERQASPAQRQQYQKQRAGFDDRAVLRGELGLGQAGAAAQPAPPMPSSDHAGVVPTGSRGRQGKASEVCGRPG